MFSFLVSIIIYFLILLIAITIHEFAHAFVADRLGDPTPKLAGRLTLNPLAHIDFFGSVFLPLFLLLNNFGFFIAWAKPVPYDPFNLKNPKRDAGLISLAGPASNLILAIIVSVFLRLILFFHLDSLGFFSFLIKENLLSSIIYINVLLAVFNMLPIHPLDGFKIVGGLLNEEQNQEWEKLASYGTIFLLLLIIPFGSSSTLSNIIKPIINLIISILIPQQLNQIV